VSKILNQISEPNRAYNFPNELTPIKVLHYKNRRQVSKITLSDNTTVNSACINCFDASCMKIAISVDIFASLEASQTDILCPTNSITIKENTISIDNNCINCGLCISSCPIGAIFFDENGDVKVGKIDKSFLPQNEKVAIDQDIIEVITEQPFESEEIIKRTINNLKLLTHKNSVINKLVVKSFESLGFPTNQTRSGDVNLRMDALSKYNDIYYPIEIELVASLDSPRDILDDVAVFCSRQGVKKSNVVGIIVLAELPNKRSEYWELLSDIESTIDLKIATIPLAILLIYAWNKRLIKINDYFLGKDKTSTRLAINHSLGREVNISINSNLIEASK